MKKPSIPVSIVIPAKNEAAVIGSLVAELRTLYADAEIIVVDDGSDDETGAIAEDAGASVVRHPRSLGNGAAIKRGTASASGNRLVFMDADGQHAAKDVAKLLDALDNGAELAVGTRTPAMHASLFRQLANGFYNRLASWMVGQPVLDLTSGFRAVEAKLFRSIVYLLPNGFSYPTTSTMALLRSGATVSFTPVNVAQRHGTSHIRPFRDGFRFLLIIFKIATLYSPLKLFVSVSASLFALGLAYYGYTYLTAGRFTNLGALLFSTSVLSFLIGLVSEQITMLLYKPTSSD